MTRTSHGSEKSCEARLARDDVTDDKLSAGGRRREDGILSAQACDREEPRDDGTPSVDEYSPNESREDDSTSRGDPRQSCARIE